MRPASISALWEASRLTLRKRCYCQPYRDESKGYRYWKPEDAIAVDIDDLTVFFSFDTIVAFKDHDKTFALENLWSKVTGTHLNAVEPDHGKRLNIGEFSKRLDSALKNRQLTAGAVYTLKYTLPLVD